MAVRRGLWLTDAELAALPSSGTKYNVVKSWADATIPAGARLNIHDADYDHGPYILARALIYAKTGIASYRASVIDELTTYVGTENNPQNPSYATQIPTLAMGRKLPSLVAAADLVGYSNATFDTWLGGLRDKSFAGLSMHTEQRARNNNHATASGQGCIFIDAYLNDTTRLADHGRVLKSYIDLAETYYSYAPEWTSTDWHYTTTASLKRGINPLGATKSGHSIDGVLPEEQRRTSSFTWPPPSTGNYPRGAMGQITNALMVLWHRYDATCWDWGDSALERAVVWWSTAFDGKSAFGWDGDDGSIPFLTNWAYSRSETGIVTPSEGGGGRSMNKSIDFTDYAFPGTLGAPVHIVALTGTITPAGAVRRAVARAFGGTIAPAGALTLLGGLAGAKTIEIAGMITPAGTLVRLAGKRLAGTVSPASTLGRLVSKAMSGTVTPAGALARGLTQSAQTLAAAVTLNLGGFKDHHWRRRERRR